MELEVKLLDLRQMKRSAEIKQKTAEIASCCNAIGEILAKLGRHDDALREHETELKCCEILKCVKGSAIAHRKIGECFSELGNFDAALKHQNKHLELALQLNDFVEVQRAWATLGRTHFFQADVFKKESGLEFKSKTLVALDQAEKSYLKALETCDKIGGEVDVKELALMKSRLYRNLGSVYDFRGDLDTCIRYMEKAININRTHKMSDELVQCHTSLSLSLCEAQDPRLGEALVHANKAIAISKEMKSKENECYSCSICSQVLIEMMDFRQARKMLLKAYKIGFPNLDQHRDTTFKLKKVIKLVDLQTQLDGLRAGETEKRMQLFEKMGDMCSEAEIFTPAIHFYEQMLKCAKILGKSQKEMGPIFSSIAQTYYDMKDFQKAKLYFLEELQCEKDANEECQILIYLEICEENCGAGYKVLEDILNDALVSAKRAASPRLQFDCLQNLLKTQKAYGASKEAIQNTEREITSLSEKFPEDLTMCSQNSKQDDRDCDGSASDESIHPSEYSDMSDSGDEVSACKPKRSRKGAREWRNEKGETALHVACIDGKLETVAKLLDKGHSVNCRDHAGWTPLHEAANHDRVDIVEMLVLRGAAIDDPGGSKCNGITPLLDAADNGHVKMMKTLVRLGANIFAKNDKGWTVVDCLKAWRKRSVSDGTDKEFIEIAKKFGKELKLKLALSAARSSRGSGDNASTPTMKRTQDFDDDIDRDFQVEIVDDDFVDDDIDKEDSDSIHSIEDVLTPKYSDAKRRCLDVNRNDNGFRESNPCPPRIRGARRMRQTKLPSSMSLMRKSSAEKVPRARKATNQPFVNMRSFVEAPSSPCPSEIEFSEDNRVESVVSAPLAVTPNLCALRVKVRIQDKLILIPVPHSDMENSVNWLSESAASRYENLFGTKPNLTLSTKDGALLCGSDPLAFVVSANEELVGKVVSWHLPPLAERYSSSCKDLGVRMNDEARSALQNADSSSSGVFIEDLFLGSDAFIPICRALQGHNTLTEINLSGNKLNDSGIQLLAPVLSTLPHIRHLDLKCNNIGATSMEYIWEVVCNSLQDSATVGPLQRLEILDLSFNPLRQSAHRHLSQVCAKLPALKRLELSSCEITANFFISIDEAVRGRKWWIQELNLSMNDLTVPGFQWSSAFNVLNASRVTKLDFGSTSAAGLPTHALPGHFCNALVHFLDQNGCAVNELLLSDCGLTDECVQHVVNNLSRENFAPVLTALDIQLNPRVSPRTAETISLVLTARM